jgi:hypothetical protein
MRAGQVRQANAFDHELTALVSDVGLAGQGEGVGCGGHGFKKEAEGVVSLSASGMAVRSAAGAVPEALDGRFVRCGAVCQGLRLCGKVARPAEAGVSGNLSGPFWPHALNTTAQPTRASVVTRIFGTFNMQRL